MKCAICNHHVSAGNVVHKDCMRIERMRVLEEAEKRITAQLHSLEADVNYQYRQGLEAALEQIRKMQAEN